MEESSQYVPCNPAVVAHRLAAVRHALGLSKAELADMLEIDRSSYTKIEKGVKALLPRNAYKLFKLYGVDMNFIYLGQVGGLPSKLSSKVINHLNKETV